MAGGAAPQPLTIWTDESRVELVRGIVAALGGQVSILSIGGPRSAQVDRLATELGARRVDDPRLWSTDAQATAALVATMESLTAADLTTAQQRGCFVATLEPVHASLDDLARADELLRVPMLPALSRSAGWAAVSDARADAGPIRSMVYTSCRRRETASLFAQLYEAWRVILQLGELPVSIDASLVGAVRASNDDPRLACGDLAAHARLPDDRAAVIHVSDRFDAAARSLRVLARDRAWTVKDDIEGPAPTTDFAQHIADDWRRLATQPAPATATTTDSLDEPLACCLASLLSARTGEPESPRKLLELNR